MKTRRWDFISDHRAEFGVQRLCRVLRDLPLRLLPVDRAGADARAEPQAEEAARSPRSAQIHTEHPAPTAPRAFTPNSAPADARSTANGWPG